MIAKPGSEFAYDKRPLVRLNIAVVVEEKDRLENGSSGAGGRLYYANFITEENWQQQADEALRQALLNLHSIAAKAGEMPVILGSGWPGVLLHEAVGHGLEGDFNQKKIWRAKSPPFFSRNRLKVKMAL